MKEVSVVIPVYNEEEILEKTVVALDGELRRLFGDHEIVLTENGSVDATKSIAARLEADAGLRVKAVVEDCPPDYGRAISRGVETARFDRVVILEADYVDLGFLRRSWEMLDDCDLVIGSKSLGREKDRRPAGRKLVTAGYNGLVRALFHVRLTETHGLKALSKRVVAPILGRCRTGHAVLPTELVIRAHRDPGVRVREIPLTMELREVRRTRIAGVKRLWKTLRDLYVLKRTIDG